MRFSVTDGANDRRVPDPYNTVDPFIVRSLIMRVADEGGLKRASFDFVLRRA